jgi:hypothetical protein
VYRHIRVMCALRIGAGDKGSPHQLVNPLLASSESVKRMLEDGVHLKSEPIGTLAHRAVKNFPGVIRVFQEVHSSVG